MGDRSFHIYDTNISVSASTGVEDKVHRGIWRVDYETFNRIQHALEAVGFTFGPDPRIERDYPSLGRWHRHGHRPTCAGAIFVKATTFPVGCRFEFFQEVVTENRNGGEYDFHKLGKMPYPIRKAFELALRAVRAHLAERGFTETFKIHSPNPDPLAWFNSCWDGDYERRRGTHRFERDETGWPTVEEIGKRCWGVTPEQPLIEQGGVRYFRDHNGRLLRGRCYGGINGMWTVVYGPGSRDFTSCSRGELFLCDPRELPRRLHPRSKARIEKLMQSAVAEEDFERAIVLRNARASLAQARSLAA